MKNCSIRRRSNELIYRRIHTQAIFVQFLLVSLQIALTNPTNGEENNYLQLEFLHPILCHMVIRLNNAITANLNGHLLDFLIVLF